MEKTPLEMVKQYVEETSKPDATEKEKAKKVEDLVIAFLRS